MQCIPPITASKLDNVAVQPSGVLQKTLFILGRKHLSSSWRAIALGKKLRPSQLILGSRAASFPTSIYTNMPAIQLLLLLQFLGVCICSEVKI